METQNENLSTINKSNESFFSNLHPSFLNTLFGTLDSGVIVCDLEGRVRFSNEGAKRITGDSEVAVDPKERAQRYFMRMGDSEELISFSDLPCFRAQADDGIHETELHIRDSVGHDKTLLCNGSPIYDKSGQKAGTILVLHDYTLQRMLQIQKVQLEQERVHLKRINAELDRFSSVAAHDLKSPLNSITQFAELLKDEYSDRLDAQGIEFIDVIINAGRRLRVLIDDLLSYAKSGRDEADMTAVDTRAVLNEVLALLRADLHSTKAALDVKNLPVVFADRIGVAQIFQNLISNALKYRSERAPVIQIRAFEQEKFWRFEIKDNGMGIRPEDQNKVFDAFKRFHASKQPDGTGLGLPICKRIVEAHGGALWLKSEVGQGTTIHFTLPKAPHSADQVH